MRDPIILKNTIGSVKRLVIDSDGGMTVQRLTIDVEVHLTAAEVADLVDHLPCPFEPSAEDAAPSYANGNGFLTLDPPPLDAANDPRPVETEGMQDVLLYAHLAKARQFLGLTHRTRTDGNL